ncbi:MAG: hypothetical protein IJI58_04290 [Bacilli bacterium]|nr:hypothetical protein [Bacilli bacterium]
MNKGYKAFYGNMENRYGMAFEEGKTYSIEGPLKFGVNGNGFHYAKRLEDTLRYFPAMEEEVSIAEVTSLGEQVEYNDDYYGYYDLFAARTIRIDKFLTREEIVDMYLVMDNDDRIIRFISGFKLTPDEIELFKLRYGDRLRVMQAISYYQENEKDVYNNQKVKKKRFDK